MTAPQPLTSQQDLPEDCYVFKHSTRCPISSMAASQVLASSFEVPLYQVLVVEDRNVSNWIAEKYSVKHESPQLIKIVRGNVARVLNHGEITKESIEDV